MSLDIVNQKDIKRLTDINSLFSLIHNKYGPPPNWNRPPGFISLSKIILEQQVSLASANAHFNKLNNYIENLTPANVLKLSDKEMRDCQISKQKTKYLRALSSEVINGDINLEGLPNLSEKQIRKALTNIKGIGDWTVDIYLIFCLRAKDIFPVGDIAVVNTMKELKGVSSHEDILSLAEEWRPIRSLATYFLWHYYLKKRNMDSP